MVIIMSNEKGLHTCCFFGHRKVYNVAEVKNRVYKEVENLIVNKNVCVFLFGSKSEFDDICHEVVTILKDKYSHISRVYVRAEYQYIDDSYKNYLLKRYDDTYYPENIEKSGRACYVERNREMINKSDYCVVYYDDNYVPPRRNSRSNLINYHPQSGTKVAYNFAVKKKKEIINLYTDFI